MCVSEFTVAITSGSPSTSCAILFRKYRSPSLTAETAILSLSNKPLHSLARDSRLIFRLIVELAARVGVRGNEVMATIDRRANGRGLWLAGLPDAPATARVHLPVPRYHALGHGVAHILDAHVGLPLRARALSGFGDDGTLALRRLVLGWPYLWSGRDLALISQSLQD